MCITLAARATARRLRFIVIAAALSSIGWQATAAAQSTAQSTAPGADSRPVIRVGVQQIVNAGALTPLREQSNVGSRLFPMIFAPLIELDLTGDLSRRAGLAESWRRIDARTVELSLRKGARFHNGDEVTA